MANLFEMLFEYKNREIVDSQIFLSWMRWLWDVSCSRNFITIWEEIKMNYTVPLRQAIDRGIKVAEEMKLSASSEKEQYENGYKEFLGQIGKQFECSKDVGIFLQENSK
jgi:predicted DNA-binding protein (UPF0278 family)